MNPNGPVAPGEPVFLTGATGYLGSHVAHELAAAGYALVLLGRSGSDRSGLPQATWVEGDLRDIESWQGALRDVRAVVHTAGMVKNWDPDPSRFDQINVAGLDRLLRACAAAGVARVVYTSSFFTLGPSPSAQPHDESARSQGPGFNDYDRTKILAGTVVQQHASQGLAVVSCLPTVLYGPGRRTQGNHVAQLLEDLLGGKLPGLIGDGSQRWNYVHVEDAARGHRLALERGRAGEKYLLGGENATIREFLDLACDLSQRPRLRRKVPLGVLMALARVQMLGARLLRRAPDLTPGMVRSYGHHWACSDAKAREELGYEGRELRVGLEATLKWLQQEAA